MLNWVVFLGKLSFNLTLQRLQSVPAVHHALSCLNYQYQVEGLTTISAGRSAFSYGIGGPTK